MPDTEIHTGKFAVQRLPSLVASPAVPSSASEILPPPVPCANCGSALTGPYCAQCGQHVADYHRSVWRFVADFFDNTFCWDNKFFRTLGPLFKQPGFLTLEFMRGRRMRYVHPLRLFLFTSAVCLAVLQLTHNHMTHLHVDKSDHPDKAKRGIHVDFGTAPPSAATPAATAATAGAASAVPLVPKADEHGEQAASARPPDAIALGKEIKRALAEKRARKKRGGKEEPDELEAKIEKIVDDKIDEVGDSDKLGEKLLKDIQQRLSWVALALLPVFALGLRAVYWRRDSFYFAHLVFSLHYHTFLLMYLALASLAQTVADYLPLHTLLEWLFTPVSLIPPIYLYLALRRMYGESRRRTAVKVFLLGFLHLLLIVIGVSAVGTYGFFF